MSIQNSPSMNRQIAEMAAQELVAAWGGRFPSWEEFKVAYREGRVEANRTVAAEAIWLAGMPKFWAVLYGAITMWLSFLLVPASIIAWLFFGWSAWWMLGGLVGCIYLFKVSRDGHCAVMRAGCAKHRELYEFLVTKGAFKFAPGAAVQ